MYKPRAHGPRWNIVPSPQRIRTIPPKGFGWLDAGLLRERWFPLMSTEAIAIYVFLCIVANPRGVSWYRRDKIFELMGIHEDEGRKALRRLQDLDLVAYRPFSKHSSEGYWQVLSLPHRPPPEPARELLELWNPPSP